MVLLSISLNNLSCTPLSSPSSKSDNKMKVSEIDSDMKKSSKVLAPNPEARKKRKEDLENPDQKLKEETKLDPKDSLLEPILTTWGSVHKETFQCLWEPILTFNKVTFIYDVRYLGT